MRSPVPILPSPAPTPPQSGGYIGVYTSGPDGVRTFKSEP